MNKLGLKIISSFVALLFGINSVLPVPAYAQQLVLPPVGQMVLTTPQYTPAIIKGIKIFPNNPLRFDFIVDTGDSELDGDPLKKESEKLIKYFLASLTTPEDDIWVNLSPYEKNKIIPDSFGQTEMGRDLLAQDYILKQLTASLMYPEDELGKKFWDRIYKKAYEEYGITDIPVDTFNKVWIMPEKAVVYENGDTAFVVESRLKVMLESDYVALQRAREPEGLRAREKTESLRRARLPGAPESGSPGASIPTGTSGSEFVSAEMTKQIILPATDSSADTSGKASVPDKTLINQIIKEVVLPEIEKEVNEGEHFAQLRQIYNSLILATWFKKNLKDSLFGKIYMDQNKIAGVAVDDIHVKERIYDQYLEAFKKGVYDYIKEDIDPATQEVIPRQYFSGGFNAENFSPKVKVVHVFNSLNNKAEGKYVQIANLFEALRLDDHLTELKSSPIKDIDDAQENVIPTDHAMVSDGGAAAVPPIRVLEEVAVDKIDGAPVVTMVFDNGEIDVDVQGEYAGDISSTFVNSFLKMHLGHMISTDEPISFVFHGEAGPLVVFDEQASQMRVSWHAVTVPEELKDPYLHAQYSYYRQKIIPQFILSEIAQSAKAYLAGEDRRTSDTFLEKFGEIFSQNDSHWALSDKLSAALEVWAELSGKTASLASPETAPQIVQQALDEAWSKELSEETLETVDPSEFLSKLGESGNILEFLLDSIESGEFFQLIPAFKEVVKVEQKYGGHQYKAGTHIMMLVWVLDNFLGSGKGKDTYPEMAQLWESLSSEDRQAVVLASLFHDLGKGMWNQKGDRVKHAEYGATQLVPEVLQRLGLSDNLKRDIQLLVRYHHFFGTLVQGDEVIENIRQNVMLFIASLKNKKSDFSEDEIIRYLKLLSLIGFADSLAVNLNMINDGFGNHSRSLKLMYQFLEIAIGGVEPGLASLEEEVMQTIREKLEFKYPPELVDLFIRNYPRDFSLSLTTAQQETVVKGLQDLEDSPNSWNIAVTPYYNGEERFMQITVLSKTEDENGVLSTYAALFNAYGLDLATAFVASDGKGGVMDIFLFRADADAIEKKKEELANRIYFDIEAIREGRRTIAQIEEQGFDWGEYQEAVETTKLGRRQMVETKVSFDVSTEGEDKQSVIKVNISDWTGVFAAVTKVITDAGLNIESAIVGTDGYAGTDMFVVNKLLSREEQTQLAEKLVAAATENVPAKNPSGDYAMVSARSALEVRINRKVVDGKVADEGEAVLAPVNKNGIGISPEVFQLYPEFNVSGIKFNKYGGFSFAGKRQVATLKGYENTEGNSADFKDGRLLKVYDKTNNIILDRSRRNVIHIGAKIHNGKIVKPGEIVDFPKRGEGVSSEIFDWYPEFEVSKIKLNSSGDFVFAGRSWWVNFYEYKNADGITARFKNGDLIEVFDKEGKAIFKDGHVVRSQRRVHIDATIVDGIIVDEGEVVAQGLSLSPDIFDEHADFIASNLDLDNKGGAQFGGKVLWSTLNGYENEKGVTVVFKNGEWMEVYTSGGDLIKSREDEYKNSIYIGGEMIDGKLYGSQFIDSFPRDVPGKILKQYNEFYLINKSLDGAGGLNALNRPWWRSLPGYEYADGISIHFKNGKLIEAYDAEGVLIYQNGGGTLLADAPRLEKTNQSIGEALNVNNGKGAEKALVIAPKRSVNSILKKEGKRTVSGMPKDGGHAGQVISITDQPGLKKNRLLLMLDDLKEANPERFEEFIQWIYDETGMRVDTVERAVAVAGDLFDTQSYAASLGIPGVKGNKFHNVSLLIKKYHINTFRLHTYEQGAMTLVSPKSVKAMDIKIRKFLDDVEAWYLKEFDKKIQIGSLDELKELTLPFKDLEQDFPFLFFHDDQDYCPVIKRYSPRISLLLPFARMVFKDQIPALKQTVVHWVTDETRWAFLKKYGLIAAQADPENLTYEQAKEIILDMQKNGFSVLELSHISGRRVDKLLEKLDKLNIDYVYLNPFDGSIDMGKHTYINPVDAQKLREDGFLVARDRNGQSFVLGNPFKRRLRRGAAEWRRVEEITKVSNIQQIKDPFFELKQDIANGEAVYKKHGRKKPLLTVQETNALLEEYRGAGNGAALDTLIKWNKRFVKWQIQQVLDLYGLPEESWVDYEGVGISGFRRGLEDFDAFHPDSEKITTYTAFWVKHFVETVLKKEIEALAQRRHTRSTTFLKVVSLDASEARDYSLDAVGGFHGVANQPLWGSSLDQAQAYEDSEFVQTAFQRLYKAMARDRNRDRNFKVFQRRKGYDVFENRFNGQESLKEISKDLGMTIEQIRQIEKKYNDVFEEVWLKMLSEGDSVGDFAMVSKREGDGQMEKNDNVENVIKTIETSLGENDWKKLNQVVRRFQAEHPDIVVKVFAGPQYSGPMDMVDSAIPSRGKSSSDYKTFVKQIFDGGYREHRFTGLVLENVEQHVKDGIAVVIKQKIDGGVKISILDSGKGFLHELGRRIAIRKVIRYEESYGKGGRQGKGFGLALAAADLSVIETVKESGIVKGKMVNGPRSEFDFSKLFAVWETPIVDLVWSAPSDKVQGTRVTGYFYTRRISEEKNKWVDHLLSDIKSELQEASEAARSSAKGGIDFNPNNINLETTGRGMVDYNAPIDPQLLEELMTNPVDGFEPVIFNIMPVTNLPALLGLNDEDEDGKTKNPVSQGSLVKGDYYDRKYPQETLAATHI